MDDLSKVYKASFAASSFFFFCVGIVLDVISSTNLPNFYNEINKEE
ncbi:Serine incorporator (Serinc) [Moritella viscosa]|uniref:Serine incorporator (Serinc) n=1 Tax=Moritella viscosa TaxID=80854 RepID=A0A1L0F0A1_9GAMM|nr:Serine incorporator (Serinc) [Moritella viscosa]SGZ06543.1 Serine incorporator (Serinc) [Moritella viscosa]SGZ06736.1 Serine incorporator (Serinc) [Moritella viscosa]SGZ14258.1 Serine incorporator (Serinc) [Moritella viscosa]SGZ14405.1 Serine incorporator (Serinc) [Moritella viscosa]